MPKRRDPCKPKGRCSAYAFFVKYFREEIKLANPGATLSFADFSRLCSQRWKELGAAQKQPFVDMGDADKERYDEEMRAYVPPPGEKKERKKKKASSQGQQKKKQSPAPVQWTLDEEDQEAEEGQEQDPAKQQRHQLLHQAARMYASNWDHAIPMVHADALVHMEADGNGADDEESSDDSGLQPRPVWARVTFVEPTM